MKVLLVEDDELLGESLKEYLSKEGFSVRWEDDDRFVLQRLSVELFDVIVLDLMLKFSSGESLIKKIKERHGSIPIIVVTAKDDMGAKEECFLLGADDYIVKPFDPKELVLRIKAVCRRYYGMDQKHRIGDVIVDTQRNLLVKDEKEIVLTQKEWELLLFLLKKRGKVVSHNDILSYVWGDSDVSEDSVRAYIKRLRSILPEGAIETCKGRGYRLK